MNWFSKLPTLSPTDAWLADIAIQATGLLALILLVHLALRRSSASRRYALLTAAALSIPLLFLLSHILPEWRLNSSAPAVDEVVSAPIEVSYEETLVAGNPIATRKTVSGPEQVRSAPSETVPREQGSPWSLLWMVGVIFLWLRLARGVFALARIKKRGDEFADLPLAKWFAEEVENLGLRRSPVLLKLEASAMPMTWGLRSQVVALPSSALEWDEEKARRVIRHELAHVVRRDCLTGWLASACLALLWFLPLSWLVRSASARAREAACDDLALGGSGDSERSAYARDLIDIIGTHTRRKSCPGMAVAFAMGAGHKRSIEQRLAAILDEKRNRRGLNLKLVLLSAPIGLALVAAFATVATLRPVAHADESDPTTISKAGPPVTKTYNLVKDQLANLLESVDFRQKAEDDPFASDTSQGSGGLKVLDFNLEDGASEARSSLITRFGIPIGSGDPVELVFENRYKLRVTAPMGLQDAIAKVLDGMLVGDQISVKIHVFEIDDSEWLTKQLADAKLGGGRAGVLGQEQFDELRAAIEEHQKVKQQGMMPRLIIRSGERAKAEMIREFIYPTEYDPPELPKDFKPDPVGAFPVTPANPTAFDVRNIGMAAEVESYIRVDGSIGMDIVIEDVHFAGFINYGSPINVAGKGFLKQDHQITLTDNQILQPLFSVSRIATEFIIPAGKFVVISSFANEKQGAAIDAALVEVPEGIANPAKFPIDKSKNRLFVIEAKPIPAK